MLTRDDVALASVELGSSLVGRAWAQGLDQHADGWRPQFDVDVMARVLLEAVRSPSWDEWSQITCPTVLVRGELGLVSREAVAEMTRINPAFAR